MDIYDEQFKHNGQGSVYGVADYLADCKKKFIQKRWLEVNAKFWRSIPRVSASSKKDDVVIDFSKDRYGHAGVVVDVTEKKKRDGRLAVVITIAFVQHASQYRDLRQRKLEFIL